MPEISRGQVSAAPGKYVTLRNPPRQGRWNSSVCISIAPPGRRTCTGRASGGCADLPPANVQKPSGFKNRQLQHTFNEGLEPEGPVGCVDRAERGEDHLPTAHNIFRALIPHRALGSPGRPRRHAGFIAAGPINGSFRSKLQDHQIAGATAHRLFGCRFAAGFRFSFYV